MKISVVIPCYNAEPYLAQTIGSVLEQSRFPDEVIVVDDGSTDGSLSTARCFATVHDTLIRIHSQRSGSQARTNNIGASLATGDALMFLDADDLLGPDVLASLENALKDHSGSFAACPWERLDFIDGKWMSRPASCARRMPGQDPLSAWMTGWYYPPCSVLWSKEAFILTGGWNEEGTINTDGDIVMRALASGISLVETNVGTSYYRRLPEGEFSQSSKRQTYNGLIGRMSIIEKIARMLEEQGQIDMYREPVSQAFAMIAADATWRFGGLCEQARKRSRQYSPSLLSRGKKIWSHNSQQYSDTEIMAVSPEGHNKEIRFGLDSVDQVLSCSPVLTFKVKNMWSFISQPEVSVIIPTYNRAYLLSRTIESVLKQTFSDFEVLIVDDCSKDDSQAVVAKHQDQRLRYLRQPENKGVAAARNHGLREARADFVAFLDDDDEWFPEKLNLQVKLFHRLPLDVGLIYSGVETVSNDNRRTVQLPSARGYLYRELLVRNILHGGSSNIMMRRNIINQVGFFDEKFTAIEDYDYWLRICRFYKVDYIDKPLVRYYDQDVSLGKKMSTQHRRSLKINDNMNARDMFYHKHQAQMRKEGLAHLFLLDSVRRYLEQKCKDVHAARRLAAKAFFLAPTSREAQYTLIKLFIPKKMREIIDKYRELFRRFR